MPAFRLGSGAGEGDNGVSMVSQPPYRYRVARLQRRPGFVDVALVRSERRNGFAGHRQRRGSNDPVVLFRRTFRALLQWSAIETYAAELARVAEHANHGTLGCFVETTEEVGVVVIALYERWFDGDHLRCDELARRLFDPVDETALVASAEFQAELEAWAEQRNEARESAYLDASAADAARVERALEQKSAATELAQILAGARHQP